LTSESTSKFPARVVAVSDGDYDVAINRGKADGLKIGQRFIVYGLSEEEIKDPDTGESLGRLEIVRGRGMVTHLQEKMATIRSERVGPGEKKTRRKGDYAFSPYLLREEEEVSSPGPQLPFEGPQVGDLAKPI
jgi:hypothetical protein